MCLFVLGLKMKNIDGRTNVGKVGVRFDVLSERAVVIKEYMVRLDRVDSKGMLEKFLGTISFVWRYYNKLGLTATLATPSVLNMVSRPSIMPHGATASCSL